MLSLAAVPLSVAVTGGVATAGTTAHAAGASYSLQDPVVLSSSHVQGPVVGGLTVLATIAVGGLPQFATFDSTTGDVYVPNWANSNVSVIHGKAVVATVPAGSIPFSATFDAGNGYVYVVNEASNNVTILNGTKVLANVAVGTAPKFASYDSGNGFVYVANSGSANVSILNGTTLRATVSVGTDPSLPVVGGAAGNSGGGGGWSPTPAATSSIVYVPNTGSGNVTVIGGTTGTTVVGNVTVGTNPQFSSWDPSNLWLYVPNNNSSTVSVLSGVSPYSVLYTVPVGTHPFSAYYQASTGHELIPNFGSANVSVLGGALVNSVVANVPVGTGPEFVSQDPAPVNELLVPNTGSGNVSILSGTTDLGSLLAGSFPVVGAVDATNADVYVQNFASANVTVLGPASSIPGNALVTFKEHGLPASTLWSVTAGTPPTTANNTTSGSRGSINFEVPKGRLNYSFAGAAGYSVAKITGAGLPSQQSDTITGTTVLIVTFGLDTTVFFNESSLPQFTLYSGANWTVTLTAALAHGGPPGASKGTSGTSLNFSLPAGASYKFAISGPTEYKVLPARGGVHVPNHPISKTVKFKLETSVVLFKETGLAKGTNWTVTLTSGTSPAFTYPLSFFGTTATIKLKLPAGTFHWSVSSVGFTPAHASGTVTVAVPSSAATVQTGPWT